MKTEPFVIERTLNVSAERVWKAITDREQMKQWYFDLSDFKPEMGFEFTFPGKGNEGQDYTHLCKITKVEPGKLLQYGWAYKNYPGKSFVTFELFPEGNATRIKLTHEGLETFPQDTKDFAKESFAGGWTYLIGKSLVEFVEA
jgi:uncharacterized protein YndB with AHSA1/START domain